jgi:hypothetical protein
MTTLLPQLKLKYSLRQFNISHSNSQVILYRNHRGEKISQTTTMANRTVSFSMVDKAGCGMTLAVILITFISYVNIRRFHAVHQTSIKILRSLVGISLSAQLLSTSVQRNIHLSAIRLGSVNRMVFGVQQLLRVNVSLNF